MIKIFVGLVFILVLIYIIICLLIYFFQERLMFFPQKISADSIFSYPYNFDELFYEVEEKVRLNALLFKAENQNVLQGLVFYLHGNAGALNTWGYAADEFLQEGYDVFIPDYRGYGKSEGEITSQKQLFQDVEQLYLKISRHYQEKKIIITGFSIGSGPASWLASRYQTSMLLLIAPFYSMTELANHYFPFLPSFLLRYLLKNNEYVLRAKAPVVLIHGKKDEIIPYESSVKLKGQGGSAISLIALQGVKHNDISGSPQFRKALNEVLEKL